MRKTADALFEHYGVTRGTPFEAGCMMYQTCQLKGMTEATHIHGVGDGAPWIEDQYEQQFGANHAFYIDYFHVTEYLAAASKELSVTLRAEGTQREWYLEQAKQMKRGCSKAVITELARIIKIEDQSDALQSSHQYLENREENLSYPKAIDADLPIGSGEVESGHRSVLQSRLKKPGAWWTLNNAETMAQIKTLQANDQWNPFWKEQAA